MNTIIKISKTLFTAAMTLALIFSVLPATASAGTTVTLKSIASESDFTYTVSKGAATIVKYKGSGGDVIIPGTLGGTSVTEIGMDAFSRCNSLTSITMPNSIVKIGDCAFSLCNNLASITFSGGLSKTGRLAFSDCASLTSISFPDNIKEIEYGSFLNCSALKTVILPENLETIDDFAFMQCSSIESITIPAKVKRIGCEAFYGCDKLVMQNNAVNLEVMEDGSYWLADTYYFKGTKDYTEANKIIKIVNQERKKAGLTALKMDRDLMEAAMLRAAECQIEYNTNHSRPSGLRWASVSQKAFGENCYLGPTSAANAMVGWMNSPMHRGNILNKEYISI